MSGTRVAVVTGSNKGIGFAIVKELCSKFDGVVYLTSRDESRGKAAIEELKKSGLNPKFHQLDIGDEASVIRLRDYITATYGGLDVLVNNAGINKNAVASADFGEQATAILGTNFFDTFQTCNILFPILKSHARVVNISSQMGHLSMITGQDKAAIELKERLSSTNLTENELSELMKNFVNSAKEGNYESYGWPSTCFVVSNLGVRFQIDMSPAYIASKIGVSALTRIQQRKFDEDSREDLIVNCVHPGYVETDMTEHKGPLKIEEGAVAPSWLALLPRNTERPKGAFVWYDKQLVDWVDGLLPCYD